MIRASSVVASLVISQAVLAHHGAGTFDRNSEVDLDGVVTGVDFVNPHAWMYFDVTDENGNVAAHRCEMRAATVLRRSGWSAEMFVPGERVHVSGRGDRFDPNSCYLTTIVFEDGTKADRYGQFEKVEPLADGGRRLRLANGNPNISGDWAPEQLVMTDPRGRGGALVTLSTVDQYEPGQGRIGDPTRAGQGGARQYRTRGAELTELGRQAADDFETYTVEDNPRMRCETTSILFDWTFDGPVNRIAQNEATIVIQYGQYGFTRTIHMELATHPADIEPSRAGHSIGRWEDDVLIVDTVGFAPGVLSPPILNSDQLHVIERFSLATDAVALTREYAAEDPVYFTGQYEGADTIHVADLPYAPDPCDELTFVDYSQAQTSTSPQSVGPVLWQPSMNVFRRFGGEAQAMYEFYGDVLGFEQLNTIGFGGGGGVARFQAGASELKLTAKGPGRGYQPGGVRDATGLRLITFFFRDEAALLERFAANGYPAPEFQAATRSDRKTALVTDPDGQYVELVVIPGASEAVLDQIEIGLTVSDLETSREFYGAFVGLEALEPVEDERFGVTKYPYRHGTTIISLRSFGPGLPVDTGSGGIQYVVSDVNLVDELAKAREITIDQPLNTLRGFTVRTIWLADPDGITNYFAETDASRGVQGLSPNQ